MVRCGANCDSGVTPVVVGMAHMALGRMGVLLSGASSSKPTPACRENAAKPQSVALGCVSWLVSAALPGVGHLPPMGGILLSTLHHSRCFWSWEPLLHFLGL